MNQARLYIKSNEDSDQLGRVGVEIEVSGSPTDTPSQGSKAIAGPASMQFLAGSLDNLAGL